MAQVGFGAIFQKATDIKWEYNSIQNRTISQSGVILNTDGNVGANVDLATQPAGLSALSGGNYSSITFTVGAPRGLKYSENRDLLEYIYDQSKINNFYRISFGSEWQNTLESTTQGKLDEGTLVSLDNLAYITPFEGGIEQANCWTPVDIPGQSAFGLGNIAFFAGWMTADQRPYGKILFDETAFPQLSDGDVVAKSGDWMQQGVRYLNNEYWTPPSNGRLQLEGEQNGAVPYQVINDIIIRGSHGGARYMEDSSGLLSNNEFFVSRAPRLNIGMDNTSTMLGPNVYFTVVPKKIPNYTITPHDLIEFNGDFVFQEVVSGGSAF